MSDGLQHVGVTTWDACYRLGENTADTGAYWQWSTTQIFLGKAVCCR